MVKNLQDLNEKVRETDGEDEDDYSEPGEVNEGEEDEDQKQQELHKQGGLSRMVNQDYL